MKRLLVPILIILVALLQSGCHYDKNELLNPVSSLCDTAAFTYKSSINKILTDNCVRCHSGANAPFGIELDLYSNVNTLALNGRLLGAINHSPGFSPMPKDQPKLDYCNISKITRWVNSGAPNN